VKFRLAPKRGYYTPFQIWKGVISKRKSRGGKGGEGEGKKKEEGVGQCGEVRGGAARKAITINKTGGRAENARAKAG
jgi:hypothetical protein